MTHKTSTISLTYFTAITFLLICSVGVGLLACEGVLQVLYRKNPDFIIKKRGGGSHPADLVSPAPPLDYALTPNFEGRDINIRGDFNVPVKINADGLRDFARPVDPNHRYIMVIGDSIMYGEGVALEETFPAILEKRLQEEIDPTLHIIKAGVPGYSERQALDLLNARFSLYKPAFVLLGVTPSESWRNISGYRYEQGFIVDSRLNKKYYRFGSQLYSTSIQQPLFGYLDAWQEAHLLLPTFLRQRRKYLKEKFLAPKQPSTDKAALPDLAPTFKQLDRFVALSTSLRFTPIVLSKDYSIETGKTISEYGNAHGIASLDLAPFFKAGEGQLTYTFPHDGHWNASTHRMVAEILFNFLNSKGILQAEKKEK